MAMKFEEVEKIIRGNLLGGDVPGVYGDGFIIQSDGVLSGREQLLFLLGELKEEYGGCASKPTVEKRVIELPADLLEKLTVEKENASGLLGFFDMDGHSAEIMNWLSEFLPEPDNSEPENIAADWYLDHVEFVEKKQPKFIINVDSPTGIGRAEKDDNGNIIIEYHEFDVATRLFTEAEADELVAGLTALNARKVKVEE